MLQHLGTLATAQTQHIKARTSYMKSEKITVELLPTNPMTSAQFHHYDHCMLRTMDAFDLGPVCLGQVLRTGPNPSPDALVHAENEACFDTSNALVYTILCRSYTPTNMGYAHTAGLPPRDGRALYQHVTQHYRGLDALHRDDTLQAFLSAKQTPGTTGRAFLLDMQLQRQNLATVNSNVTDRTFNNTIIKGLNLLPSTAITLKLHIDNTVAVFLATLETVVSLDKPSVTAPKKRALADVSEDVDETSHWASAFLPPDLTCFNCGAKNEHFAQDCPLPYDADMTYKLRQEFQASRSVSDGGRGGGKGGKGGKGRGGRGGKGYQGRGGKGSAGRGSHFTAASVRDLVNAIRPTLPAPPPPTAIPEPAPSEQARVDNLVNNFFEKYNATIGPAQVQELISRLCALTGEDETRVRYWLYDTACGSHISNTLDAYVSPPTTPAGDMFSASGQRMPATNMGTVTMGVKNVRHIPSCTFCIFSPKQFKMDTDNGTIALEHDRFKVVDSDTDMVLDFLNIEGFYLHKEILPPRSESPESNTVAVSTTVEPPVPLSVAESTAVNTPLFPSTVTLTSDNYVVQLQEYVDDTILGGTFDPSPRDIVFTSVSQTKAVYTFLLWHQRLNHMPYQTLLNLISQGKLPNFPHRWQSIIPEHLPSCKICGLWRMHRVTLKSDQKQIHTPPRPGMVFYIDCKKFSQSFHNGWNALIGIVDIHSHFSWVYWIKIPDPSQNEVFLNDVLKGFYVSECLPRGWRHSITLHPDNAPNFVSRAVKKFCLDNNTTLDPSTIYKPQTNSYAEALMKILVLDGMCALAAAKMVHLAFPFAVIYCNYIRNRIPGGPDGHSPIFRMDGTLTDANFLHIWACGGYLYDYFSNHNKIQARGNPGRFLSFMGDHQSRVVVYDEVTGLINDHGVGDFVFNETNTEALIDDLDINKELDALKVIEAAAEKEDTDDTVYNVSTTFTSLTFHP
jgi:hypothetical protein